MPKRGRNCGVVSGRVGKRLAGQVEPEGWRRPLRRIKRRQHRRVVGRVDHDEHVVEVFCRRTDHAGTADVDLLDEGLEGHVGLGGRLDKRVEVDHDDVDEADAVTVGGV